MKSLMLKLSTILLLSSSLVFASTVDEKVLSFLTKSISTAKSYNLKDVTILEKQDIESIPGWKVYFVKYDLDLVGKNKEITITDKIFTNGNIISKDFVDINTRRSLKGTFVRNFDAKLYSKLNLIEGNFDAKYKLVVFSDPLCPFCMSFMPDVIDFVKKHPKEFGLFYYHFPLSIHPNSKVLIKAGIVAEQNGVKDVLKKVYEEAFDFDDKDDKIALSAFNKVLGTTITLEQINKKEVIEIMDDDIKIAKNLMINGTPTLYVNGKLDKNRIIFKKMVKDRK